MDHAVDYFKELKKKYGAGRERKTELRTFDTIVATKVAVANRKLYLDRAEGFVGWGLRNFELVGECSDIDDIIVFRDNGTMLVTKVADKKFIGKGILHVGVWKKNDDRTIYHLIYQDGTEGCLLHEALRGDGHHARQGIRPDARETGIEGGILHGQSRRSRRK